MVFCKASGNKLTYKVSFGWRARLCFSVFVAVTRCLRISFPVSVIQQIIAAIQIPSNTKRPTVPKVFDCPLKSRTANENKNKKGMRTNKNIETVRNRLGIRFNPKRSKGHSTVPKNKRTIVAVKIAIIDETATNKKTIPSSLKMILGIALSPPSKN